MAQIGTWNRICELQNRIEKHQDSRIVLLGKEQPDAQIMAALLNDIIPIGSEFDLRFVSPGRSGAKVILVLFAGDRLPLIVKFGDEDLVEMEIRNYLDFIKNRFAPAIRVELNGDLVKAEKFGAIAYTWAGGRSDVQTLRDFFAGASMDDLTRVVRSLLEEITRWQASRKSALLPFDRWRWDEDALKRITHLIKASSLPQSDKIRLSNAAAVPNAWRTKLLTKQSAQGRCHGDLNARNVLVTESGSGFLPILIDFASIRAEESPARDWAKLEREIKFGCLWDADPNPQRFSSAVPEVDSAVGSAHSVTSNNPSVLKAAMTIRLIRLQYIEMHRAVSDVPEIEYLIFLLNWSLAAILGQDKYIALPKVRDAILRSAIFTLDHVEKALTLPAPLIVEREESSSYTRPLANPAEGTGEATHDLSTAAPSELDSESRRVPFITNLEYLAFVEGSPHRRPQHWASTKPHFPSCQSSKPVTYVSWDDAVGYCDWKNGRLPCVEDDQLPIGDSPEIGEWRDAGNERQKTVYNPTSLSVEAVDRDTARKNIGFCCVPVRTPQFARSILVDGGSFRFGTNIAEFEALAKKSNLPDPQRRPILRRQLGFYNVSSFKMSAGCVTNEEYFAFTKAHGIKWPLHWHAKWFEISGRPFPARLAFQPVVNMTAEDAQMYCNLSRARLPSWLEWERAASGPMRQPYPWGSEYISNRCNSVESGRGSLAAVHEYPMGDSHEGVRQLCGNVGEWVLGPNGDFEIRGGSYRVNCELWGLAYAFREVPQGFFDSDVGFRVVIQ